MTYDHENLVRGKATVTIAISCYIHTYIHIHTIPNHIETSRVSFPTATCAELTDSDNVYGDVDVLPEVTAT